VDSSNIPGEVAVDTLDSHTQQEDWIEDAFHTLPPDWAGHTPDNDSQAAEVRDDRWACAETVLWVTAESDPATPRTVVGRHRHGVVEIFGGRRTMVACVRKQNPVVTPSAAVLGWESPRPKTKLA
jgi:hypothetical protein